MTNEEILRLFQKHLKELPLLIEVPPSIDVKLSPYYAYQSGYIDAMQHVINNFMEETKDVRRNENGERNYARIINRATSSDDSDIPF